MIDPRAPDYSNKPVSPVRSRFGYAPKSLSQPPIATIITSFCDAERGLEETANSILQQSLQQWEWIVISYGHGSSQIRQILGRHLQSDPRLRLIELPERTRAAARNAGCAAARSKCLVYVRCGDILEPTTVEKWFWLLESNPNLAFADAYSVHIGTEQHLSPHGFRDGPRFLQTSLGEGSRVIRKDVHEAVGGYDETLPEEMAECDYWLRCARLGERGETLPEYLVWSSQDDPHRLQWHSGTSSDVCNCAVHASLVERVVEPSGTSEPRAASPTSMRSDALISKNLLDKQHTRLLLLVPHLTVGGSEKASLDLVQQLSGRGWDITIATTIADENVWLPQFSRSTPDIFVLANFLQPVDYPRFLSYLISSRQIDCVLISNSEFGYQILPYLRSQHPDVALADLCHVETEYWRDGGYARMSVEFQELLDLNITSTDHLKQWMAERGAEPDRIHVAYTNVDCGIWAPDPSARDSVRHELGLSVDVPVVLFVGRVCADKQPRVIAHTALRLHETGTNFVMLVTGGGPDLPWLESFVAEHELGSVVRLLGAVPYGCVEQLMRASDIFFLPSRWEGIAVTLFEALGCGLPPVAADVGGQRELVTPECGVLISGGDEAAQVRGYTVALAGLLRDPARRAALGKAGRARVEAHFSLPDMGTRMELLLRQAIEQHQRQPRPSVSFALGRALAEQAVDVVQLRQSVERLETARSWADEQRRRWESVSRDKDVSIAQFSTWVSELKDTLAWTEEQRSVWQQAAELSESQELEQARVAAELEEALAWTEGQRHLWQQAAEESHSREQRRALLDAAREEQRRQLENRSLVLRGVRRLLARRRAVEPHAP